MIAMTAHEAFLTMWLTFAALALLGLIAVFIWAVRSRQFSDQDRARHLALTSGIPDEKPVAAAGKAAPPAKPQDGKEGEAGDVH